MYVYVYAHCSFYRSHVVRTGWLYGPLDFYRAHAVSSSHLTLISSPNSTLTNPSANHCIPSPQNPVILLSIRSAAHVVKGAAANLMCEPLRAAAYGLEMVAKSAPPNEPVTEQIRENLQRAYEALQEAARNYKKFVDNQDI